MNRKTRIATGALAALLAAGTAALAAPPEGPRHGRGHGPEAGFMGGRGGVDVAAIDTDGDGVLTRAELQARAVERLGRLDADGDGTLDRAELVAAFPARGGDIVAIFAPDPGEAAADRLLAVLGKTTDGKVTVVELAEWRVNDLMSRADASRDDALQTDEVDVRAGGPRGWRGGPRP